MMDTEENNTKYWMKYQAEVLNRKGLQIVKLTTDVEVLKKILLSLGARTDCSPEMKTIIKCAIDYIDHQ